jgi:hypothetical protein
VNGSLNDLVGLLRDDPRFLAGWLRGDTDALRQRLELSQDQLNQLLICKAPRPSSFATDVESLAQHVDAQPLALAAVLREAAAIASLRERPVHEFALLAARDAEQESARWRTSSRVRSAVKDFWSRLPGWMQEDRSIEEVAPLALPLAVVPLPRLRISSASRWLATRGVELALPYADRPLRGLLLSWRGSSLLFVDGGLESSDRCLTVGHEIGHVTLHYLPQRTRLLRLAPALLGVVDGHREVTAAERVSATLEGLPFGVQAHMLARDADGAASASTEAAEREAAEFALELMAPERAVAQLLRRELPSDTPYAEALERAQALVAGAFALPPDEAKARARGGLAALGRSPGFFER